MATPCSLRIKISPLRPIRTHLDFRIETVRDGVAQLTIFLRQNDARVERLLRQAKFLRQDIEFSYAISSTTIIAKVLTIDGDRAVLEIKSQHHEHL